MSISTQNLEFEHNAQNRFQFPDVNLQAGENLLVLGSSGSGKTTWLHLLAGILTPKSGEIQIGETKINTLKNRKLDRFRGKNIGLVFQQSFFVKALSVKDNLLLAQKLAGQPQNLSIIEEKLAEVGMAEKISKLPSQLSVGEQQRISIARATLNQPILLLADEPTSALDDENAEAVIQLLKREADAQGAHLVVVTHDFRIKSHFQKHLNL